MMCLSFDETMENAKRIVGEKGSSDLDHRTSELKDRTNEQIDQCRKQNQTHKSFLFEQVERVPSAVCSTVNTKITFDF